MKMISKLSLAATALFALSGPLAAAGIKDQLVGTWSVVSNIENWDDGKKEMAWGPDLKGLLMFDGAGHYSFQMGIGGRPKSQGNPADDPKGKYVAYVGTYDVDKTGKLLSLNVERCSSPNLEGGTQKRLIVSLTDSELVYKAAEPIKAGEHSIVPTLTFKKLQ